MCIARVRRRAVCHHLVGVLALFLAALAPAGTLAVDPYTYTTLNDPNAGSLGSTASGISNNGTAVGNYQLDNTQYVDDDPGFIYSGGTYSTIQYPYPVTTGQIATYPYGINNSGQTVGVAGWNSDEGIEGQSGFLYINGGFTDLNYESNPTYPIGINDSGQIVGYFGDNDGPFQSFLYSASGGFTILNYPGATSTQAEGINNEGQIVGVYNDSISFLYSAGTYTTISNIPAGCDATAINDLGQIVGFCEDSSFLYSNGIFNPNILPSQYLAFGINNSGQISGEYFTVDSDRGFIATPTSPQADKNLGNPCDLPGSCGTGEPISIATGNVFYQINDYQTAGQNQLRFDRYYNSRATPTLAMSLGMNWRCTYDRYIRILSPTSVFVERKDGQQVTFTYNGTAWTTDTDVDLHLTNSGSTWTLTDSSDTVEVYTTTSGGLEAILNTITSRNGYTQTLTYNGSNQLQLVKDSYNRSLGFTYNNGFLQTVTTPDSLVLTYGYTTITQGTQLTSVSYNTSPVTSTQYNYGQGGAPFSALTSIIDENGNTYATWTYDSLSRGLTSQNGPGANLTTVTYNGSGTTTVTNAFNVRDTYTFTTLQNVPKITQISRAATATTAAATRTFGYDGNGYLNSATDWDGNLTTYTNDARGQPTVINEAVGSAVTRTTNITYDTTTPNAAYPYHIPTVIVTPELTTNFNYDPAGDLLTKVLTDTTTTTIPYVTAGQTRTWTYTWLNSLLQTVQTPRTDVTNKTTFTYDGTGALTQIKNALSQNTNITQHTGGGLPLTIVNPNSITTNITYDPRNHLLTSTLVTNAGNFVTTYGYDAAENLTSVTLPDGSKLTNGYDTAHRLTSVTDLFGNNIQYTLDALGDRTLIETYDSTDTLQRQHSGMFDALGRITQDIGGEDQITKFTYDPNGNTLHITDPLSHLTQQTYDALNRLATVTDPTPGGTTTTTYDPHDRPLTVQAPNGATTNYVYDGFGDIIQQASPDSGTTVYYYNPDSDLTQKVDATGATTNNTYDALDRVLTTAYPSDATENVAYTYDQTTGHGYGIGMLTSLTDAPGSLSRTYNARGDVAKETRVVSGNSLPTTYTFDAANRIASIAYPSGTLVTYIRDTMGRITSVTSKAPGAGSAVNVATGIGYEPFGPLTGMTFGNSVVEARGYDLDYRLDTLTDNGTSALQNLTYVYDAANNVKTITDAVTPGNSQTLTYDTHNRLKTAAGNYGSLAYSYDTSGNRLYQTVAPATTYTYTPNSNLLATVKTGGVTQTIGTTAAANINSFSPATSLGITALNYNQANRLATALAGTTQVAAYTYDAFGQRLVKTTSAATLFQYDLNGHLLEELNGSGVAQADYLYLGDMPIATLTPTGGALYYLHDESLGTPQLATSASQGTAWQTTYQPFGTTGTITGTLTQNLRLPGQYADAETGFSQNGARDYVPGWGRYLEADPMGLVAGVNTYGYAGQNPLEWTDRSGKFGPLTPILVPLIELLLDEAGVATVSGEVAATIAPEAAAVNGVAGAATAGSVIGASSAVEQVSEAGPAEQQIIEQDMQEAAAATQSVSGNSPAAAGDQCTATSVTVTHFTDAAGVQAITDSGTLQTGTYVTLPTEVGGLSSSDVESLLEIESGRGEFSTTFQVPPSQLVTPANGPLTSGGITQYQLTEPATPGPFIPTTPGR
jgi:RHS repeat-associated protein